MLSTQQQQTILAVLLPYNPVYVGVFGSYSRNQNRPDSDLDLLVDLNSEYDLFDLFDIKEALSEKLGIRIDLVTKQSLSVVLSTLIQKDLRQIN